MASPGDPDPDSLPKTGLEGYVPLASTPDELIAADGRMRPHWKPLIDHLRDLPQDSLAKATARADQYLLDSGVFYRQYGSGQSTERPWPLSHIPVMIDPDDWAQVSAALIQRATLLEALMADLYGPNNLVAANHLPASLVAGNPEWLRPVVGIKPRSGHFLHFLAFDIGRGPRGKWWVLADRTQAPSGAGYALENRVATSRAFASVFAEHNVHRLAGFFRDFRDRLLALRRDRDSRVAILSPGPLNETYYEHAYIARYLGFTLVQGEDLSVENGAVMVRTVSGLRPADVLWRRLDGNYADPLELDPSSRIGTPGLASSVRRGGVTLVNALGSGILETRALMAFLPKLAPRLIGEDLLMPNIATWWLGGEAERNIVKNSPANLVLNAALGSGSPLDRDPDTVDVDTLSPEAFAQMIETHGAKLVAQEEVTLSTTPALVEGRLQPRPMSLRVFLARTETGWQVMPGGFARIGATPDPAALGMQQGGSAADVWIMSREDVDDVSMMRSPSGPFRRTAPGALPSRAADNLFWLGRYVERAEGIIRLLRSRNIRVAETGADAAPLLTVVDPLIRKYGLDPAVPIPQGLLDTIAAAVASAGQVRDRFSPDGWSALNDLNKTVIRLASTVTPGDDAARALSALLRKLAGFSGLVHENMYRFFGWRFLSIGRLHERAMGMSDALAFLADPKSPPGSLDFVIEVGDSVLTHRRRFTVAASRDTVVDLLALDPMNPRSIRNQIDGMLEQIDMLPGASTHGDLSALGRAMLRLHAEVATETPESLTTEALIELRAKISGLSDLLTEAYLR